VDQQEGNYQDGAKPVEFYEKDWDIFIRIAQGFYVDSIQRRRVIGLIFDFKDRKKAIYKGKRHFGA